VTTPLELAVGEITEIAFTLPGSDRTIRLKASVRRVDQTAEALPQASKEFQGVSEEVRRALEAFCAVGESSA